MKDEIIIEKNFNVAEIEVEEKVLKPKLEKLEITPSQENQHFESIRSGYNDITVYAVSAAIDESIQPENIKAGINILGVEGKETVVDTEDATAIAENILEGQTAYVNGEKINGGIETYDGSYEGITELPQEGLYLCRVVDYDGAIIKEAWLSPGSIFELPEPPEHEDLVFEEWVSPVEIIDNTVLVEDQDIIIGPIYDTKSGATELHIELNRKSTLTIFLGGRSPQFSQIDWGDGNIDSLRTHTYEKYGRYIIKIYGMTKIPMYWSSTSSGNNNFKYCLRHLRISSMVTEFGNSCFNELSHLETVTLGKSLKKIPYYDFNKNYLLKTLVIPNGVEELSGTVSDCGTLTALVLPYGLKKIGSFLCNGCGLLEYLSLPDTIEEIGNGLLRNNGLVKKLHLPKNLYKVDESFQGIGALKKITGELPDNEDCDYTNMFSGTALEFVPMPKNTKALKYYCGSTRIKTIVFPDGVEDVSGACSSCKWLEEAYIPDSVKVLSSMFTSCIRLRRVRLPAYLEIFDGFYGCYLLQELIMPSTIQELKGNCLFDTRSLQKIDFSQHTFVPTLAQKQNSMSEICQIIVPDELYDEWIAATNWSAHADLIVKKSEVIM